MGQNTEGYYSGLQAGSQMKADYVDRHSSLKKNWSKLEQPKLPRLPSLEDVKSNKVQLMKT